MKLPIASSCTLGARATLQTLRSPLVKRISLVHRRAPVLFSSSRAPQLVVVRGADHVLNTPNPDPPDAQPTAQLRELIGALAAFALECRTE
jgi:hypothetical protein